MLTLGIDPGLQRTGFAVITTTDNQPPQLIDAGIIKLNPKHPIPQRLATLADDLNSIITHNKPNRAAVESLFSHYKNPTTAIAMGHARGVILCTLAQHQLHITELKPTAIKKSLTNHGHATKEQVANAVAAVFNLPEPPSPSDVADAIAIAHCAALRAEAAQSQTEAATPNLPAS